MNKFQAAFVGLLLSLGKNEWADKVKALSGEDKVDISAEQLGEIKAEVDQFKSAKETAEASLATEKTAREKAESDLKAVNDSLATKEAEATANATKITELEAKVAKLGKLPGAESLDPNASGDKGDGGSAKNWMTDEVKAAGHNQFAEQALNF